jgi:hypothetical protein
MDPRVKPAGDDSVESIRLKYALAPAIVHRAAVLAAFLRQRRIVDIALGPLP